MLRLIVIQKNFSISMISKILFHVLFGDRNFTVGIKNIAIPVNSIMYVVVFVFNSFSILMENFVICFIIL